VGVARIDGGEMMSFTATTTGPDKLGLRQALELFANEQWITGYLDDEQRVAWVRTLAGGSWSYWGWKYGKNGFWKNFWENCCLPKNMLEVGCGVGYCQGHNKLVIAQDVPVDL